MRRFCIHERVPCVRMVLKLRVWEMVTLYRRAVHTSYCTGVCRTGPCLDSSRGRFLLIEMAVKYITRKIDLMGCVC